MTSSRLSVECLALGPLSTNCFLVWDDVSKHGVIIDPGEEAERILTRVNELELKIDHILATHCHFDHIGAVASLVEELGVEFLAHEGDLFFVQDAKGAARKWGFDIEQPPLPDRYLKDGDEVNVGNITMKVIHTPGHSPGGVSFYGKGMVFAGDCLFQRSIGRTDFRMGSLEELSRSIKTRLYTLPDETVVHTGHGPTTTIGEEKRHNPFVRV